MLRHQTRVRRSHEGATPARQQITRIENRTVKVNSTLRLQDCTRSCKFKSRTVWRRKFDFVLNFEPLPLTSSCRQQNCAACRATCSTWTHFRCIARCGAGSSPDLSSDPRWVDRLYCIVCSSLCSIMYLRENVRGVSQEGVVAVARASGATSSVGRESHLKLVADREPPQSPGATRPHCRGEGRGVNHALTLTGHGRDRSPISTIYLPL